MRLKNTFFAFLFFSFTLPALAGVTGNPDVFNTGVWVKHPGIAVGKLFATDSRMITVAGDGNGYLHAWYPNGSEIPGFPKLLNSGVPSGGIKQSGNDFIHSTAALVDSNGDGNLEIFVGSGDGYVYGLNNQGSNLPGWPKFTGVSTGDGVYGVFSSPAVADIDGDGNFEVIVGAWSHYIYVWNAEDGSTYPGWPFNNADTVWSSPAVADFDKDGKLEIVIGCDSTVPQGGLLRVFRYNGTQMTGWPQAIDQVIWSSPAIGDIDNDGQLEIVVGTGHFYGGLGEYVNAYEWNGSKVTGWPVSLADGNSSTDNRVFGSPALADVDANGTLEVFVGALDGYLYCINSTGSIRWRNTPVWSGGDPANFALLSSPTVGDVDGDGRMEVVVGGGWHITAFDAQNGTKEAGYPIETGYPDLGGTPMATFGTPAIADVNGDGLIDLVIGNGRKDFSGWSNAGGVRVYHESGPAGTSNLGPTGVSRNIAPWPRFHMTNSGTGSTNDVVSSSGGSQALLSNASASPFVFSPNGDNITDTVTVSFTLSASDSITVEILDRNGAVVSTVLNAVALSAGNHTASWNGLTSSGAVANDGMYTFRVRGAAAAGVQGSVALNNSVPEVSRSWFLAEGSTLGFHAYVLIQNPNPSAANVTVTFFKQDGTTKVYTETVAPLSRTTVPIHREVPDTASVSTGVDANVPIIVERAMYFNLNDRAGHNSIGVTRTSMRWYFPANRSFIGDEDFILIVNPSSSSTQVTATFYFDNQAPLVQTYSVAPTSRYTIPVHGIVFSRRVSVELSSTLPVAAERAFYFSNRAGGASGIGAVSPSLSWYFAEGDTSVQTLLEMFNPTTTAASVTVNYMLENGTVLPRSYTIPGQRRVTIDVGNEIGGNLRHHTEVLSTVPIVAERLMFAGADVADSIGSPTPAHVWNLAEGFTAFGYQTWVLVSNPGNEAANVTVRFMQQNGVNVVRNYVLAAKQRLTLYANDFVEPLSISTQVSADKPIVVERTMKFANGTGMHQALGVRQ